MESDYDLGLTVKEDFIPNAVKFFTGDIPSPDFEGDDEHEGAPPGSQYIQVTKDEREAIERLEALGFERSVVIQAFFACDKDENMTANYLLEHAGDIIPDDGQDL